MGEIPLNCGQIYVSGKLSFACQDPWVFAGTIRDNILFGNLYDEDRYRRTLDACALDYELDRIDRGDGARVGPEVAHLPYALKSKINLAR